jgi:DNA-binding NarL/FixJ family response regulator
MMNPTLPPLLRILIADDHDVVRQGLQSVIDKQPNWAVCGAVATGRVAVEQALELKPDLVILDVAMSELNGLDPAIQIKRHLPGVEILIFSAHQTCALIRKAFEIGAKSFILKSEPLQVLVEAIESLARNKPYFTAKVSEVLFSKIVSRDERNGRCHSERGRRLTLREREIVQLLAEGKSNKEVAGVLGISVRTVETHRAGVLRKLELDSTAGLVRYAIRNKMIEP